MSRMSVRFVAIAAFAALSSLASESKAAIVFSATVGGASSINKTVGGADKTYTVTISVLRQTAGDLSGNVSSIGYSIELPTATAGTQNTVAGLAGLAPAPFQGSSFTSSQPASMGTPSINAFAAATPFRATVSSTALNTTPLPVGTAVTLATFTLTIKANAPVGSYVIKFRTGNTTPRSSIGIGSSQNVLGVAAAGVLTSQSLAININPAVAAVPEPSTVLSALAGVVGLVGVARRRRTVQA